MDFLLRLIFLILISTSILGNVQGKINTGHQQRLQRSKTRLIKAVRTPRVILRSNVKRVALHPVKINKLPRVTMKAVPKQLPPVTTKADQKPQAVKAIEQDKSMKKKNATKSVPLNATAEVPVPIKIEVILLVHEIGNKVDSQGDERLRSWPQDGRDIGNPHQNKYRLNWKPKAESPLTTTEDYERQNYFHVNPSFRRADPSFYRNGTRCPKSEISFCWDNGSCSWWQICKTVDCVTACHTRSGLEWQWVK